MSGTAAIDEQGRSLYPGDVRAQIDCTFDKIAALIGQEGATLTDIAAACVFVKRPEDALVYQERAAARGLENLPAVVMVADVCREELLFEIDAEVAFDPSRRGSDSEDSWEEKRPQGKPHGNSQAQQPDDVVMSTWLSCLAGTLASSPAWPFLYSTGSRPALNPQVRLRPRSRLRPGVKAGFQPLKGRWQRPDGGYVIEIKGVERGRQNGRRLFQSQAHQCRPGGSVNGRDHAKSVHRTAGYELPGGYL